MGIWTNTILNPQQNISLVNRNNCSCIKISCEFKLTCTKLCSECLVVFCMLKANTRLVCLFCYLSDIDISKYVTKYSTCTRPKTLFFIILELIPMYTLVSEVHVCIKVTLKGKLSSSRSSSVHRASGYKSHGYLFESHCRQEFSFCNFFFAYHALLTGRLVPYKWNQAWHSSEVIGA